MSIFLEAQRTVWWRTRTATLALLVFALSLAFWSSLAFAATSVTHIGSATAPAGLVWLPGPAGTAGHLWVSDGALGFCRLDPSGLTACNTSAHTPGQPAFDARTSSVYVPDASATSQGVWRLHFNAATEAIDTATLLRPTDGLGGNRPTSTALDPASGALYVGFSRTPNIVRITNPSVGVGDPKVVVGNSSDGKQTFSLAFLGAQLVDVDSRGLASISNPATCTGNCTATSLGLTQIVGPLSVTTRGNVLFAGDATGVWRYDGTQASTYASGFSSVTALALDPQGVLYAGDGAGHIWQVTQVTATAPSAPTAVSAVAGNAQATVSWTAPANDGGSPISSYTITSSSGLSLTVPAPATSATVIGLTNGTAYTFSVTASNAVGTSPASAASNSVTPFTVPGAPTGVSATAGNAQASVSWTAPVSDGGSAITSYTLSSSSGQSVTVAAPATSATVTGLTNGTAYTFTVTAANAAGSGPASAAFNSVTPFTVPGAPTAVSATAASGQATISWTAPANDGGSPISSYTVTSSSGLSATVAAPQTTLTLTGLTNGTAYTFSVTATNAAGAGPASAESNSVTPSGAPAPVITQNPPNPTADPNVSFAFTSSTPGASFQCSLAAVGAPDSFTACTSPTSQGPLADGAYVFKLIATDPTTGETSAAAVYQFTVSTSVAPTAAAPTAQTETGGTASTRAVPVTIAWSATACSTGEAGCNIASYHLRKSINGAAFFDVALPTPTTTSIVEDLTPSPTNQAATTTYRYEVQATDTQGTASPFAVANAFSVASTDDNASVSYTGGGWSSSAVTGAFGGAVHASSTAGAAASPSTPFSGTGAALISTLGPDRGIAQVSLDGQVVATVDLYAPTQTSGAVVWSTLGLASPATHTLKVTVLGTHNPASRGNRVDVDAFVVIK